MSDVAPIDIRTLSYAEHFITWVLRTAVACAPECRMIHREFCHAFGRRNAEGAQAFEGVLLALAKGERPITLARPGHIHLTRDETSLMALFAAAQARDEARFCAHARWVLGHDRTAALYDAAVCLTGLLYGNGHVFRTLPPEQAMVIDVQARRLHVV
ncbi:hypothetical protein [Asticcacaulis sp. 201]|uniref:hypothetical protein n=1 Tax=Asticcacaulis sp. 201 TaxID=3028787 RepID=UPI002916FC3B|nr:hypothetical protein [Asticcacaulis sp. 201]MDV6331955.1 hypothetical protein [Asticcacaulis sp. 201]